MDKPCAVGDVFINLSRDSGDGLAGHLFQMTPLPAPGVWFPISAWEHTGAKLCFFGGAKLTDWKIAIHSA